MRSINQDFDIIKQVWGKTPKILVGAPHYDKKDYALPRYAERVQELRYPKYDILIADNSESEEHVETVKSYGLPALWAGHAGTARERVRDSRNLIREYALEKNYDFVFFYDTDIIARRDILTELLKWGKKVIGGWYYVGLPGRARPVVSRTWTTVGPHGELADRMGLYKHMIENRLMRSYLGAMGVQLIHRDILERFEFVVNLKLGWFADSWFFYALEQKGIPAYTDTEMLCPHFASDWGQRDDI